jgi:hypothetical protein
VTAETVRWRNRTPRRFDWKRSLAAAVVAATVLAPSGAPAIHLKEWTHDHSRDGVPHRPQGHDELVSKFGRPCGPNANDARAWFPHAVSRDRGGYVVYHQKLARNIGYNIRLHIDKAHLNAAIDYGVYGYACRLKTGGTEYSVHAWGAAVDTNTARNPYGQDHWNGRGADGEDRGTYIPSVWKGENPGHYFLWGLRWNDPHHFQYVTGY